MEITLLVCPSCKAPLKTDDTFQICQYCGGYIYISGKHNGNQSINPFNTERQKTYFIHDCFISGNYK